QPEKTQERNIGPKIGRCRFGSFDAANQKQDQGRHERGSQGNEQMPWFLKQVGTIVFAGKSSRQDEQEPKHDAPGIRGQFHNALTIADQVTGDSSDAHGLNLGFCCQIFLRMALRLQVASALNTWRIRSWNPVSSSATRIRSGW